MSDKFLHHEGHERPDQDWQGGARVNANPYLCSSEEREQAYRELMAEEERQKKLAELGGRVLERVERYLFMLRTGLHRSGAEHWLAGEAFDAVRYFGLLQPSDDCEPRKPDHASQDRASFERETLERYMGGE